jgi:hypothetical protein
MEGSVMRKLLSLILVLGLANPIAPVLARDGDKSLAGKARDTSKKEREAELDTLYDQATEAYDTWRATQTEEEPHGTWESYSNAISASDLYDQQVDQLSKNSVSKDYEVQPVPLDF